MKLFSYMPVLLFLLALTVPLASEPAPFPGENLELVESIPLETNLDNPHIRNTQAVWVEMVEHAQESIALEHMYYAKEGSDSLETVIAALHRAAKRGVTLRIIGTPKFQKIYPNVLARFESWGQDGLKVEVRLLEMQPFTEGGIQHAKFMIVDGREVFLGSQNFDWRALDHIHELGVRVNHPGMARAVLDLFELDWQLANLDSQEAGEKALAPKTYNIPFKVLEEGKAVHFYPVWAPAKWSPSADLWSLAAILEKIEGAKKSVAIELLNYNPVTYSGDYWAELDMALRAAAARGVQVRLICSNWSMSHPKIDHLKSLHVVPNIEVKLSTIPEHSSGFIPFARVTHAKFMVVDGTRCWLGCSNWSRDYYYKSRDLGIIIENGQIPQELQTIFDKDWQSDYCEMLDPCREYKAPRRQ